MFSLIVGIVSLLSSAFAYTGLIKNTIYRILLIVLSITCGIIGIVKTNREETEKSKTSEVGETLCILGIAASIVIVLLAIIMTVIWINIFKSWFSI